LKNFHGNIYAIKSLNKPAKVQKLHIKQIGKNLFIVELETGGFKNLICSYLIKGKKPFLVESGPTSSI